MEKLKTRATSSNTTLNAFSFVGFSSEKLFYSPEWVSIWALECSCPSSLRPCAVYVLSEYSEYCVRCSEMRIYYLLLWRVREYNFTISLCSPPPRSVVLFYLHFPKTHNTVCLCELLHFIWSHNCCYIFLSISEDRQHSPKIQYTQWMKWRRNEKSDRDRRRERARSTAHRNIVYCLLYTVYTHLL